MSLAISLVAVFLYWFWIYRFTLDRQRHPFNPGEMTDSWRIERARMEMFR